MNSVFSLGNSFCVGVELSHELVLSFRVSETDILEWLFIFYVFDVFHRHLRWKCLHDDNAWMNFLRPLKFKNIHITLSSLLIDVNALFGCTLKYDIIFHAIKLKRLWKDYSKCPRFWSQIHQRCKKSLQRQKLATKIQKLCLFYFWASKPLRGHQPHFSCSKPFTSYGSLQKVQAWRGFQKRSKGLLRWQDNGIDIEGNDDHLLRHCKGESNCGGHVRTMCSFSKLSLSW